METKTKWLMLIVICFVLNNSLFSQSKKIYGRVVDAETNTEINGAEINLKNSNETFITNSEGKFIIENNNTAESIQSIIVSYSGYNQQEVKINNDILDSIINVKLISNTKQLKDVVVSANKRLSSVQKTPMSITAISPEKLERLGAFDFKSYINGTPNVQFSPSGDGNSGRASQTITIRGIAGAGTTAMYLDETPLPSNIDIRLLDEQRVEILNGPQGTLYGSRNMGGAVKTITNQPSVKNFDVIANSSTSKVQNGSIDQTTDLTVNLPITKQIAVRASAFYDYQSGIFNMNLFKDPNGKFANVVNKQTLIQNVKDTSNNSLNINTDGCSMCATGNRSNVGFYTKYGANIAIGFYPTENLSIIPKISIYRLNGDNGYDFAEGSNNKFPTTNQFIQTRASGIPESFLDNYNFYSLTIKYKLAFGTFINSTSYFDRNVLENEDSGEITLRAYTWWDKIWNPSTNTYNMFAYYMSREVKDKQFNQEFRFESNLGKKFEFTAGIFYNNQDYSADWNSKQNGKGFISYVSMLQSVNFADAKNQNINQTVPIYQYIGNDKISELAFFGEAYYKIMPTLKATFGLRWYNAQSTKNVYDWGFTTYDAVAKYADGLPDYETGAKTKINNSVSTTGFNPKFGINWAITPNKMLYANIVQGYRLGGNNDIVNGFLSWKQLFSMGFRHTADANNSTKFIQDAADGNYYPDIKAERQRDQIHPKTFAPDYIWNYEVGFKGTWLDGTLITNVALFYNSWTNLQQTIALNSGYYFTMNVGNAYSAGLEFDVRYKIFRDLEIAAGIGLLDARLLNNTLPSNTYDSTGKVIGETKYLAKNGDRILGSAPISGNVSLDYNKKLNARQSIYANVNLQYVGERLNSFDLVKQPYAQLSPYTILGSRIGFVYSKFDISIFAKNLTNNLANFGTPNAFSGEIVGRPRFVVNRPLTIGVTLSYKLK